MDTLLEFELQNVVRAYYEHFALRSIRAHLLHVFHFSFAHHDYHIV